MLFSSSLFLFAFLPLFFGLFFLTRGVARNAVLLGGSLCFYAWGAPVFIFLVLASSILDYYLVKQIVRYKQNTHLAKLLLAVGIGSNLSILLFFKYTNFLIGNLNDLFSVVGSAQLPLLNIALPIGISFIVFEKITYLVDVFRGIGHPATSLRRYMTYVFLFPKLLAGPIVKYHDIQEQLEKRTVLKSDIQEGFARFLFGLTKKVLIADTCGEMADKIFAAPYATLSFADAWMGAICFTIQIYFDFSAYSDMAIGLARMMGFKLKENFNSPYVSTSFTDFWHRWHISLSSWIKEYLYIPLGGNQKGVLRTHFNLWVCFLLSGLWHGSTWNFVIWGAYNGFFLIFDKIFWLRAKQQIPPLLQTSITFVFVIIGWVIFRSTDMTQCMGILHAMFVPSRDAFTLHHYIPTNVIVALTIGFVTSFISKDYIQRHLTGWVSTYTHSAAYVTLTTLSIFSITKVMTVAFNPFLYFRF